MTVVHLVNGETESADSVTVAASGWVFLNRDTERRAFPPHMVEEIVDLNTDEQEWYEGLSAESPHGRV